MWFHTRPPTFSPSRWIAPISTLFLLSGCGNDEEPPNQRPTVELTTGPVEGETVSYSVEMVWSGSDPDGVVDRYEYAVDPPPAFTETEIAEGGPGLISQFVPGDGVNPDVTLVSKVQDGVTYVFGWVHTRESSHRFRFTVSEADSTDGKPTGRFTGMHAVYVRAIDDDEAASLPDKVAFTAETIAPTAEITRPNVTDDILVTGSHIVIEWDGVDPDAPDEETKPIGYVFKLVRVDSLDCPLICFLLGDCCDYLARGGPWVFQAANETSVSFSLDVPGRYAFGVRAVDEAGAEEPFIEWGRNAFRFQAFEGGGTPLITLTCDLGTFSFTGTDNVYEAVAPAGTDLVCTISCSAESYGEECADWRWGFDVPDLEGDEGWSEWTTDPTIVLSFPRPGLHVLYVNARDTLGNESLATVIINLIDLTFDKELLYVDDSFDDLYPRDSEHDAFWRSMIEGYGAFDPAETGEWHVHLNDDRGALNPIPPLLDDLGRYKTVLWECRGSGYNGTTALFKDVSLSSALGLYLRAGGKLWLGGRMTVAATTPDGSGLRADLYYPKEDLGPGNFAYDFLKLHSTNVNNDKGLDDLGKDNLVNVKPYPGKPVIYERMDVDFTKLHPVQQIRGVSHADAVFGPIFAHSEPGFRGTIDSLYAYGATGPELLDPPRASPYQNRLCALRWHDPDPDREQGRVQWLGFSLYFFNNDQAQETFNRSMDWFREEEPPVTAAMKGYRR